MINWNMNGEGYTDYTAGAAMKNISREERKQAMAKKRSCRRTAYENSVHEKAVKIRKMTDGQSGKRSMEQRIPSGAKGGRKD